MSVRVRYAPSPTGSPHVGNIRTALFCHFFARHHDGVMFVRIEDTDRARTVPGVEQEILESIRWAGIEWQEGPDKGGPFAPYKQSERQEQGIYQPYIDELLNSGNAYKAFDTPEELDEMRQYQQINKKPFGYFGGAWRDATPALVDEAEASGKKPVIRLRMPRGRMLVVNDAIRGRVEFESDLVDDPVLIKADGMPTYHFAAMVDDHLMGTTHVIRGEEWISSAPKHVWLFEAFGWEPPVFVHVPVIKGKDGAKLSKRHGDTKMLDYRAAGYLPGALANFITLIGWSPGGDREIMSMEEIASCFKLEGLQPSPGVFDADKLKWMNGNYIRALTPEQLISEVSGYVTNSEVAAYFGSEDHGDPLAVEGLALLKSAFESNPAYVGQVLPLEQERVTTLAEFGPACAFFFVDEVTFDEKAVEKWFVGQGHVEALFNHLIAGLDDRSSISLEECRALVQQFVDQEGLEKLGPAVHPTRVALTGKTAGPGLFELMEVLGPARMLSRLQRAKGMIR